MALEGNMIIAQSGGPTTVINAGVQGAVEEAMKHSEIKGIYAAHNSILGVLKEEIFDLIFVFGKELLSNNNDILKYLNEMYLNNLTIKKQKI